MRKIALLIILILTGFQMNAQLLNWSPLFPNDTSNISITIDATQGNQALLGFNGPVYLHIGVITNLSTSATDWKYVPTTWGSTTAPTATPSGTNQWTFTLNNPRNYFNVPPGETILQIALLFRNADGSIVQRNADQSDMYIPLLAPGNFKIRFTSPDIVPTYIGSNVLKNAYPWQTISVKANSSTTGGQISLFYNGTRVAGPVINVDSIMATITDTTLGVQTLVAELVVGNTAYDDTIRFITAPKIAAIPVGIQEGINYSADCTSATLLLLAPFKKNAFVIGEFPGSNWSPQAKYLMNKTPDSNYYWLTLTGLTPGYEYAFQYLVDNTIYIADAFTETILDPYSDSAIPAATYPNLKPYPNHPNVSVAKNGIMGTLKTCAQAYPWKVTNFEKPDKYHLVIYELLIRACGDSVPNSYQLLIDSFAYFKKLGINAIELMPVNEFTGNVGWGYNPAFYAALDKAYGTKNKFKEFVDLCHQNGIAVLLDVVYNQLDALNTPQGKLYWDSVNNRPAADNIWLNPVPPHPYGVLQDLNHTSLSTQYLVEHSLEYWINEFKIDGFRFDLAKGFTQTVSNTSTIENYDASRVQNLFRYYDYIVPKYPNTYMVLEFLSGQRSEDIVYGNHGFLSWSYVGDLFNQCTMGFAANSNLSKLVYNSNETQFQQPAAVSYLESHDEERLNYKNINFGNSSGTYNVKNLPTALERQAAAAAIFFAVPGPKLFFEFGERGYDLPHNYGGNNLAIKPPHWEYMQDTNRLKLFNAYSKLINFRLANKEVFSNPNFSYDLYDGGGLFKRFQIADTGNNLKLTVIANFDVTPQTRTIPFQNTGNWYNYLSNGTGSGINGSTGSIFNIGTASQTITLQPGEYHVYISHAANKYIFIGNGNWSDSANWTYGIVPPTNLPAGSEIILQPQSDGECILDVPVSQHIQVGSKLTIKENKRFRIPQEINVN